MSELHLRLIGVVVTIKFLKFTTFVIWIFMVYSWGPIGIAEHSIRNLGYMTNTGIITIFLFLLDNE